MSVTLPTKDQWGKVLKTTLYVGISAALAFLIAWLDENPAMFGIYAPIINVTLVTIRQIFKGRE